MRNLLISIIVCMPIIAQGQLMFGVHAGANFSNAKFTGALQALNPSVKSDLFFGITTGLKLAPKLSVLTDVQYSVKGHIDEVGEEEDVKFKYQYLDIIPQIEYRLLGPLALSVGFNFGLKLSETSKVNSISHSYESNLAKPVDFGLVLTAKAFINKLYGFVRYNHGLTDNADWIISDRGGVTEVSGDQFNRNWQLGVGFTLF